MDPQHLAATQQEIGGRPQLGGYYFDNAHRPSGFDSMRLSCPIAGNEILQAISDRTKNIKTAKDEIVNRPKEEHDGSFSCACDRCEKVRCDFSKAIRLPLPLAPPPPFEKRALPPSTPPPNARLEAISEEEPALSDQPADNSLSPAPIAQEDVRWLQAAHAFQPRGDDKLVDMEVNVLDTDRSSQSSDLVSHVSVGPLPITDSDNEWDLPEYSTIAHNTNDANPNASYFDIASVSSDNSWYMD